MSESPSRRAAGRPPGRPPGDDRSRRGRYDERDRYDERYDERPDQRHDDRYDDRFDEQNRHDAPPAPPRRGNPPRPAPARSGGSGGSRRAGAATGAVAMAGGPALPLGPRLGMAFVIGAIPALLVAFLCGVASSGGSSRSIAGVTLNSKLLALSVLAIPAMILIIGGLLRWRRLNPLGLTWGFTVVAGLSWLTLLFAAQMEKVIPHLTPLLTVPLVTGAAVAAAAYLTDENTTTTGRYACLAAVIASHIGIVAIVVTIVLA
ncbi:hypothetical protein [Catenulispora rubra]|uniref:hypothetical protein n=1 Tax=Catenulispora rubra TaxID=280293 RepID=UPI0018927601|nr:hypothetical protein [Catenulispora rubra]